MGMKAGHVWLKKAMVGESVADVREGQEISQSRNIQYSEPVPRLCSSRVE